MPKSDIEAARESSAAAPAPEGSASLTEQEAQLPQPAASPQEVEKRTTSTNRIARNFLSLSAISVFERLIALFSSVYVRNLFQAAVIGQIGFAAAMVSYAGLLVSPGLQTIAMRDVAREPRQGARYAGLLFLIQLALALVAFGLIVVFGPLLRRGSDIQLLLLLNAVGLLFLPLDLTWILLARERLVRLAIVGVLLQLLQLAALLAFIHGPSQKFLYVLLPYPFRALQLGFIIWYVTRHKLLDWRDLKWSLSGAQTLLKAAIPIGLTQATVLLYGNSDVIFLGMSRGSAIVGLYSTAYSMMLVPTFIHAALTNAFFPALSRASGDSEQAARVSRQLLRLTTWIGFPLAALGWAVGRHALALIYRSGFAASGPLFEWLCLNLAFLFFNVGYLVPLLAWQHQSKAFRCTLAGAAVNVALNVWLIPHLGAWGAVISTIGAEAAVLVSVVLVRRAIHPLPWLQLAGRPLVVCVAAGGLTRWAIFWMPWWCAALLGMVVCGCGCAWLEPDWKQGALNRLKPRNL